VALEFHIHLAELIKRSGHSLRHVARKMQMDHAYLSRILSGKLKIPAQKIDKMADALGLIGEAKHDFIIEAHLSRSPRVLYDYVHSLRNQAPHHGC
jgi:transcriptional regulator with XRE-family HTH domain